MRKLTKAQVHIGVAGYPMDAEHLPPRDKFTLTAQMTLLAVAKAIRPYSAYIGDEVQKMHREHVKSGGTGYFPRSSLILSRLNALAVSGLVARSRFPNGYYGYAWDITDAGRKALEEHNG